MIAGAGQHGGIGLARAVAKESSSAFGDRWIELLLAASLQRRVRGDQRPVLEDADFVSQDMDIEHTPARRVGHAVEIAADADHAFMRDAPFQPHDRPIGRLQARLARTASLRRRLR